MQDKTRLIVATVALTVGIAGCATKGEYGEDRKATRTEKGAVYGAAAGAALGALVSKDNRTKGALIGAVGGAIAGGSVGAYMDSQRKDFEKQLAPELNAGSITIEKKPNDVLLVSMTSDTGFDVNSATIKKGFQPTMLKISKIVNQYGKTHLTIVGHTDSTGSEAYNQSLSERRARSVEDYLLRKKVAPQRLAAVGRGESQPRADNRTAAGRKLNRRVDIVIEPVVAN